MQNEAILVLKPMVLIGFGYLWGSLHRHNFLGEQQTVPQRADAAFLRGLKKRVTRLASGNLHMAIN